MNDPIDDMQNYKWGIIYFNRHDPRIFVPRKLRLGFTLNFAHAESYLVLFIIISAIFLLGKLQAQQ